jgi:hypothetical protein
MADGGRLTADGIKSRRMAEGGRRKAKKRKRTVDDRGFEKVN